jgi:hypothetical protein
MVPVRACNLILNACEGGSSAAASQQGARGRNQAGYHALLECVLLDGPDPFDAREHCILLI